MQGIVIAGTHSGCGKTTITLGMLAALKKKGHKVQPFKAGPDFIDTGLHGLITGRTSRNLDVWMCGKDYVTDRFHKHAADADIAVVEGVMGMFDGNFSTADLAAALGLPVILVVDAYGMAESAGAIVKGFMEYSAEARKRVSAQGKDLRSYELPHLRADLAGVIFNRVASERHYKRLKESVQDVPVLGYLPRDLDFTIPHRHLGLVVAEEQPFAEEEIDKLADTVLEHIDVEHIARKLASSQARKGKTCDLASLRACDLKIGVAYDKAFCFYYEDNLDLLKQAGAEVVRFSPLSDSRIPDDVDALYFGGGYPELYAERLSGNRSMIESVRCFADEGRPVYAECGGFMYLTDGVYDFDNAFYPMAGAFPFKTRMIKGRARLGYREAVLMEDSILGSKGDSVRGHEFHYSEIVENAEMRRGMACHAPTKIYAVKDGSASPLQDEGYRVKNTFGSYIHVHFGSNELITKKMVDFIRENNGKDSNCRTRQS